MVNGLHTIWCQVTDMDVAVYFYREVLGLNAAMVSSHWSEFDLGNGKIALHSKLEGASEPLGEYRKGWFLGMRTNDIQGLRKALEDYGAPIHGDYHDIPSGVVLDFSDPDGNTIEAIQVGKKAADLV